MLVVFGVFRVRRTDAARFAVRGRGGFVVRRVVVIVGTGIAGLAGRVAVGGLFSGVFIFLLVHLVCGRKVVESGSGWLEFAVRVCECVCVERVRPAMTKAVSLRRMSSFEESRFVIDRSFEFRLGFARTRNTRKT